jgi:hypothetical protein
MRDDFGKNGKKDWRQDQVAKEIDLVVCAIATPGGRSIEWVTVLRNQDGDRSVEQGIENTTAPSAVVLAKMAMAIEKVRTDKAIVTFRSNVRNAVLAISAAMTERGRNRYLDGGTTDISEHFAESSAIRSILGHADRLTISAALSGGHDVMKMAMDLLGSAPLPDACLPAPGSGQKFCIIECVMSGDIPRKHEVIDISITACRKSADGESVVVIGNYSSRVEPSGPVDMETMKTCRISIDDLRGQFPDVPTMTKLLDGASFMLTSNLDMNGPFLDAFSEKWKVDIPRDRRCISNAIDWKSMGQKTKTFFALCRAHKIQIGARASEKGNAMVKLLGNKSTSGRSPISVMAE